MNITQTEIDAAESAIQLAQQQLNAAKSEWDNATFWERMDGSRKRKYEAATQALKDAQSYYQQLLSVDYAEDSLSASGGSQSSSIIPVVLAGLVAVGVLIYLLKK